MLVDPECRIGQLVLPLHASKVNVSRNGDKCVAHHTTLAGQSDFLYNSAMRKRVLLLLKLPYRSRNTQL